MSSPFDAPESEPLPPDDASLAAELHAELSRARPAQFGLAGCGLLLATGFLALAAISAVSLGLTSGQERGLVAVVIVFYGVLALVYGVPALLIGRAAFALGGTAPVADRLRTAVRYHRQFWQVIAVVLASVVLVYGVGTVGFLTLLGSQLNQQFESIAEEVGDEP